MRTFSSLAIGGFLTLLALIVLLRGWLYWLHSQVLLIPFLKLSQLIQGMTNTCGNHRLKKKKHTTGLFVLFCVFFPSLLEASFLPSGIVY